MKANIYSKILVVLLSVYSLDSRANALPVDSEAVKAGIYEFMDKTMLNGKPAPAGSGYSVVYKMNSDEVCQYLNPQGDADPSIADMCDIVSGNIQIKQKVYSKTKGQVVWFYKNYEILTVNYSAQEEISYVLDVKAIYDTASDITSELGATDAEDMIAQYFPKAGKFKVLVQTPSNDRGLVKFEVLESLDHRVSINGEEIHVKFATGNNWLVDVNKATKVASASLSLDGLEAFIPGALNPIDYTSDLHLTNTKLGTGFIYDINQAKITLNELKSDSLVLQIGDNESVSLHSAQPISFSGTYNSDGIEVKTLKNNFNLTAVLNTSFAPSQYQGTYTLALSKDDHFTFEQASGDMKMAVNNLQIKGPTEFFRALGVPMNSGSAQTEFSATKIAAGLNIGSAFIAEDVELKNITLKADADTLINIDNNDKINVSLDSQMQEPIIVSGFDHFKIHADTNFLYDVAGLNLPPDEIIKFDIDSLATEVDLSAGYSIKDTQIENMTIKVGNDTAFAVNNNGIINVSFDPTFQSPIDISGINSLSLQTNTNIAKGLLGTSGESLPSDEMISVYVAALNGQASLDPNTQTVVYNNLRFNDGMTTGVSKVSVGSTDIIEVTHSGNFTGNFSLQTGIINLDTPQSLSVNVPNTAYVPMSFYGNFNLSNAANTQWSSAPLMDDSARVAVDAGQLNLSVNFLAKENGQIITNIACDATLEGGCDVKLME